MATQKNWKVIWKRTKLYIILGIAVFSFAILGMIQGGSEMFSGGGAAAIVNKEIISLRSFSSAVKNMESNMGDYFQNLPAAQRENFNAMIRQQALDQLINRELIYQAAEKRGFVVPSAAIVDFLVQQPAFQEGGQFSRMLYDQYLNYQGIKASDLERDLGKDLVIQGVQQLFTKALFPTELELKSAYMARNSKVNAEYVEISTDELSKSWPISNSDINAFKEASSDKIKSYFEANKQQFSTEKQVKASHILVQDDLKRAQKIKKQLDEGADFAKLAREHSKDPGSASKGGDLGFFGRGAMVEEFEQKAFSMAPGDVSEPVKTSFGYHIIKVTDVRDATQSKLEEVQDQIAKKLLAEEKIEKWQAQVEEVLKADSKQLNSLLSEANLSWKKTGEFNLNQNIVPDLGDDERLLTALLELKEGEVADRVFKSRGKSYLLKLTNLKKAEYKQAKAELAETIAQQKTGNTFSQWVQYIRENSSVKKNNQVLSQLR